MGNEVSRSLPRETKPFTERWEEAVAASPAQNREELYEELVDDAPPTDPFSPVTNPKEGAGAKKPPTWSVMPRWIIFLVGRVMQIGAAKYDAFNYRDAPITASTYEDAIERHLALWFDGENNDPETGVSHLASVIASCALLLDSQAGEMLVDNRQKTGKVRNALDALDDLMARSPLPPKNPNAPSLQKATA